MRLSEGRRDHPPTLPRTNEKPWTKLKKNKSIQIVQADKGNATVILDAKDYDAKVHALLDDQKSYRLLKKDPTKSTERKFLDVIRDLKKKKKICESFYEKIRPSEGSSKPALFYGRIKLHKEGKPLRPVVATCGTATYGLARQLSSILRPLVASSKHIIKNTKHLVDYMEWIVLQDDEMLVSFDVKGLFTSIPVSEAIEICERRLQMDKTLSKRTSMDVNTIISLIRFCLTNTSFLYGGKPYQQLDGVAMGSPLSPVIADIFMADLEEKAL